MSKYMVYDTNGDHFPVLEAESAEFNMLTGYSFYDSAKHLIAHFDRQLVAGFQLVEEPKPAGTWLKNMMDYNSCPKCHTLNARIDETDGKAYCLGCGRELSEA